MNIFKENFKRNDRDMSQENNALISGIDEVNNCFIERRTVDIAICKIKQAIDHSNMHSNHIKRLAQRLGNFHAKCLTLF